MDAAARTVGRWALAGLLAFAGIGHFMAADAFLAQVPPWMPWPEAVVAISGGIEVILAGALVLVARRRPLVGWIVAGYFVLVFPGNISQFVTGTDAFGLDTDAARAVRLLFQPLLIMWALWCTSGWRTWRTGRRALKSSGDPQEGPRPA